MRHGKTRRRARIINWTYLGYSLSAHRRDADSLRTLIADLAQLAHSRRPLSP